jgi:UDP-glucose:glycoprotein glucosyltransferase
VRKNLWNVVLALDLSLANSLNALGGPIANVVSRNYPFRFGVVPLVETEDGARAHEREGGGG